VKAVSRFAFQCSVRRLFDTAARGVCLWSFTFPVRVSDWPEGVRRWEAFRRKVNKLGVRLPGIRVAEWHPGGHGWHFHVLTSVYRRVEAIRGVANSVGFGRINVIWLGRREKGMTVYLAKHFSKDFRVQKSRAKGQRKWACIGGFKGVRNCDIEVTSTYRDFVRARLALLGVKKMGVKEYHLLRREWLVGRPVVAWERERVHTPGYVAASNRPF